jgi:hypothetical protein
LRDVLSPHRAVRIEEGEVLQVRREALCPQREALHAGRAVLQLHRAVLLLLGEDRLIFNAIEVGQ